MLNHIVIMGRLTRDPELRYTQSQTPVASFTLAVDRDRTNDQGERATDFIDCIAWRQTGEFVNKYFRKGSMAVVAGRLTVRDWTDRDGNKRRSAEVVAENVYFGESKRKDETPATPPQPSYTPPNNGYAYGQNNGYRPSGGGYNSQNNQGYSRPQTAFADLEDDDGDLPF
ncbi:MAG: single-stranded DNA-binding protein [Oscillospiraceae bacterium]|nr:single-stranded DNA-binding protein [Oscillospiraceae bacterium]